LRKSPARWLRGRLPRLIEQRHDRTAAFTESSRSNGSDLRVVNGWSRPILLKNSVFKITSFSFAICCQFRIVDTRR
jgi:hypothetical protein